MEPYILDNSGIYSLSGFSYQIRVFVYYMLKLKEGMQIEFETIDDINMKKIKPQQLDDFDEKFLNKIVGSSTNETMQVKRTTITQSTAVQVLLNWILLESSEYKVSKYTLFTDAEYNNTDILFSNSAETLLNQLETRIRVIRPLLQRLKKYTKK